MFKYKLSIIVPCYNSKKTIARVMNSIINNDLNKDEYEIIIVDDNSTDNFMEVVKRYEDKANIVYYKTDTDVHCPGNTRQVGLDNARGEWITFIDHDDYFEVNIFKKVFQTIESNEINSMLGTSVYYVMMDGTKEVYDGYGNFYVHHGKFYNHQMLLDGNIRLKKDLVSYEDVYFNNIIEAFTNVSDVYKYVNYNEELFTYNWTVHPESLSQTRDSNDFLYMDLQFKNYIYAVTEPFFALPERFYQLKYDKIMPNFLKFYFIYQQGLYRFGDKFADLNRIYMHNFKQRIREELKMSDEDIINDLYYIHNSANYYAESKETAVQNLNKPFIELQSLYDFILTI